MYSKPSIFKFDQTLQYMFVFKFQVRHTILDYRKVASSHAGFFRLLQRYTYRVLQTIQMKLKLLYVWAEPAILGSSKTALKFKYEI